MVCDDIFAAGICSGESTSAVAAGVNLLLSPKTTVKITQLQVSPDCAPVSPWHALWHEARH